MAGLPRCPNVPDLRVLSLGILVVFAPIPIAAEMPHESTHRDLAQAVLEASGVRGGLIVHLGCGDGELTAELAEGESFFVHGLEANPANVASARYRIQTKGLGGRASVEQWTSQTLPYADNLVNLLVAEDLGEVTTNKVIRVLVPGGVALLLGNREQGTGARGERVEIGRGVRTKIVKQWPEGIDEWTHFLHDASGNAVAHDRVVAPPRRLQWIGGPLWSRSHEYDASLCAMVSSGGRLFYIFDEGPTAIIDPRIPDKWTLIARDAFNGVVLWKRAIADWGWKAWKRAEMEPLDWRRMPSQRMRLPVAVPRRLVAAGDRVYVTLGYRAPLAALDAATGRTLTTYAGTERTDEIVHEDGLLVLCIRTSMKSPESADEKKKQASQHPGPGILMALEADTGRRLWQTEPGVVVPLSLALSSPHVLYHDRDAIVCLDAATGKQRWRSPTGAAANSIWNTDTTLAVHDNVLLCANRKQLVALSVTDGKMLWKLPGARGFGIANPPDLFVADDVVWYGRESLHAASITGYDPLTGKPARTVDLGMVITRGHHPRCYRSKATDNYLLLPKRAVEFVDIQDGEHCRHNWVRGACRYGLLPCNGLLYSTPHPCFCYAGTKLGGFLALAPRRDEEPGARDEGPAARGGSDQGGRLERGPAYHQSINHQSSIIDHQSSAWPMYRRDPKRSGSTTTSVEPQVGPLWKTPLGGKLSQPVIVENRLFVAQVDARQVCCLDAATGQPIWDYTVGGRVDSAPTYYRGRLIFGSADGRVYCLRASDGALAWRFRAAPEERRVVAFGQVESAWPVHGSVLVMGDMAYFAAGRSSFLDGGSTCTASIPSPARSDTRRGSTDRTRTPNCSTRTPTPWKGRRATSWSPTARSSTCFTTRSTHDSKSSPRPSRESPA